MANNFESSILPLPVRRSSDLVFPGEDRAFGGSFLFVDLIPSSCWFVNVRSCVSRADWDRIRRTVYGRADHACEICGSRSGAPEAHERWSYSRIGRIQRLERLVCLCSACHEATHMGLAQIRGHGAAARAHIMRVNGWSSADVDYHVESAFETWHARSRVPWRLDLSIIEAAGIVPRKPDARRR